MRRFWTWLTCMAFGHSYYTIDGALYCWRCCPDKPAGGEARQGGEG